MARIKLERAINELKTEVGDGSETSALFAYELNRLNNEIHLLDHRKGDAEKALARILEEVNCADDRASCSERLKQAEEGIEELEQLHDDYVEQLGKLRDRIVTELDKLIEKADRNQTSNEEIAEITEKMHCERLV